MLLAVGGYMLGDLERQSVGLASGFAGGVGGSHQEMCGALSGGVLVIGGVLGRENLDEDEGPAIDLVQCYRNRFLDEFGETQCERLRRKVQEPGGLGSCVALVERAAMILLELLQEAR